MKIKFIFLSLSVVAALAAVIYSTSAPRKYEVPQFFQDGTVNALYNSEYAERNKAEREKKERGGYVLLSLSIAFGTAFFVASIFDKNKRAKK